MHQYGCDIRLKSRITQRSRTKKIRGRFNKHDIDASEVVSKNKTIATISLLGCGITKKDILGRM